MGAPIVQRPSHEEQPRDHEEAGLLGPRREQVLYGLLRRLRGVQRYTLWRVVFAGVATAAVAALPLTDTLRFDLWRGQHHLLGERVGLVTAAKAFAFPFLGVNVLIILMSRFLGRWLCGFACPVGALARLGEWARFTDRRGRWKVAGPLAALLASGLLSAITFSFWVDWEVFREGSGLARGLSVTFLGGMALGLFGIVQGLGLRFCRDLCPSGIYFALLGPNSVAGVEFARPEACTDCGACDLICPMDLHPREMASDTQRDATGLYPEALSNFALCIRCGDCVVACEGVGQRGAPAPALRMGWLGEEARGHGNPAVVHGVHGLGDLPSEERRA